MIDVLPADPKTRRLTLAIWGIAAAAGTAGVWWLSSYLDALTTLAHSDRNAALQLFRTRVLPALIVVVAVAVIAGGMLLRQGLRIISQGQVVVERAARGTVRNDYASARVLGWMLAVAGFLLAAFPLGMLALVFWLLRRA